MRSSHFGAAESLTQAYKEDITHQFIDSDLDSSITWTVSFQCIRAVRVLILRHSVLHIVIISIVRTCLSCHALENVLQKRWQIKGMSNN